MIQWLKAPAEEIWEAFHHISFAVETPGKDAMNTRHGGCFGERNVPRGTGWEINTDGCGYNNKLNPLTTATIPGNKDIDFKKDCCNNCV